VRVDDARSRSMGEKRAHSALTAQAGARSCGPAPRAGWAKLAGPLSPDPSDHFAIGTLPSAGLTRLTNLESIRVHQSSPLREAGDGRT